MTLHAAAHLDHLPVTIRAAVPGDLPHIYATWLQSFEKATKALQMTRSLYFSEYHRVVEGLLKRATVLVVCPEDEPAQVCGYLVFEPGPVVILHWAYVKQVYRRMGLFRRLLLAAQVSGETPFFYTHKTHVTQGVLKNRGVYNPLLLYRGPE